MTAVNSRLIPKLIFHNIEKDWRKFFEIRLFLKMTKIIEIFPLAFFSVFWNNQCLCRNKRYISRKPLISALIWHLKVGLALSWGRHTLSPQNAYFVEFHGSADGFWLLFWLLDFYDLSRIQSLSGCHFKAEYQGFLLRYSLFQCRH